MTNKDTATIREVYNLVNQMRQEMQSMKSELKGDFKSTMDTHCEWAKETVAHYEVIAQDYNKRIKTTESFMDNAMGKLSIVAGVIGVLVTIAYNMFENIFAKN